MGNHLRQRLDHVCPPADQSRIDECVQVVGESGLCNPRIEFVAEQQERDQAVQLLRNVDQQSRTPESLAGSFALTLRSVNHWKLAQSGDAILVVSPEHERTFREAGWSKARLRQELDRLLMLPAAEMVRGAEWNFTLICPR